MWASIGEHPDATGTAITVNFPGALDAFDQQQNLPLVRMDAVSTPVAKLLQRISYLAQLVRGSRRISGFLGRGRLAKP